MVYNEDVEDIVLVVMFFELIGLKIIFDVDLRDVGKIFFVGMWIFCIFLLVGRGIG